MDTEKQRQRRGDDTRLTESGNARSEQLNTCGAYRVAIKPTEFGLPEWIRTSKARLVFRYKISDLFLAVVSNRRMRLSTSLYGILAEQRLQCSMQCDAHTGNVTCIPLTSVVINGKSTLPNITSVSTATETN